MVYYKKSEMTELTDLIKDMSFYQMYYYLKYVTKESDGLALYINKATAYEKLVWDLLQDKLSELEIKVYLTNEMVNWQSDGECILSPYTYKADHIRISKRGFKSSHFSFTLLHEIGHAVDFTENPVMELSELTIPESKYAREVAAWSWAENFLLENDLIEEKRVLFFDHAEACLKSYVEFLNL